MVWEPFAVAVAFGLLVSAAVYFMFLWPGREPAEPEVADPGTMTNPGTSPGAPAASHENARELAGKIP